MKETKMIKTIKAILIKREKEKSNSVLLLRQA